MPRNAFFPRPTVQPRTELDQLWSYLSTSMDIIMAGLEDGLSYLDYLNLYTAVYNYYTSGRRSWTHKGLILQGIQLLKYYVDEWDRYTTGVAYLDRIFAYHYRHWVKRERDEGRRDVHETYIHALLKWKCHFLERIQQDDAKLTKALLLLLHQQRDGELINQGLIKKTIDSFVSLGLDETNPATRCLDVYRDQFEISFLQATSDYYRTEAKKLIAYCSPSDYLKHVDDRLQEEKARVAIYLPQETEAELITKCEDILLRAHSSFILEDFHSIAARDKFDDIKRLHTFLSNLVPHGLQLLLEKFEDYVERAAVSAVSAVSGEGNGKSEVSGARNDAIAVVRNKNLKIVNRCFDGDTQFSTRLGVILNDVVARPTLSSQIGPTT